MKILLRGYFDRNFGDDMMLRLVISSFKEHDFYINHPFEESLTAFSDFENVYINAHADFDAVVYVIGTGFIHSSNRVFLYDLLTSISKKKAEYKKSAVIGCSIEPFIHKYSQQLNLKHIKEYRLITCRDSYSFDFLKNNVRQSEISFYPDMLFSLADSISSSNGSCLGISPLRRANSTDNFRYYKELAKAADYYIETKKSPVLLFAFDTGAENDLSAALCIKQLMKNKEQCEIIAYDDNGDNILKAYKRCCVFIGTRFHSMVIALMHKIPVLGISDREKMNQLSKEFGFTVLEKNRLLAKDITDFLTSPPSPAKLPENISIQAQGHIKELKNYLN